MQDYHGLNEALNVIKMWKRHCFEYPRTIIIITSRFNLFKMSKEKNTPIYLRKTVPIHSSTQRRKDL